MFRLDGAAPLGPPGVDALRPAGELFQALANPLRLAIVLHLGREPHCVHDLVQLLGVSQPLVSQHLRVLRGGRLVAALRQGKEVLYSLQDDHVRHIAQDAVRHIHERNPAALMTQTTHRQHDDHAEHTHGPACGHAAVEHGSHIDYLHEGHAHAEHDAHWDECEGGAHGEHAEHDSHVHGDACGHTTVEHGDHVDYEHDGHRHAAHGSGWDEH